VDEVRRGRRWSHYKTRACQKDCKKGKGENPLKVKLAHSCYGSRRREVEEENQEGGRVGVRRNRKKRKEVKELVGVYELVGGKRRKRRWWEKVEEVCLNNLKPPIVQIKF